MAGFFLTIADVIAIMGAMYLLGIASGWLFNTIHKLGKENDLLDEILEETMRTNDIFIGLVKYDDLGAIDDIETLDLTELDKLGENKA